MSDQSITVSGPVVDAPAQSDDETSAELVTLSVPKAPATVARVLRELDPSKLDGLLKDEKKAEKYLAELVDTYKWLETADNELQKNKTATGAYAVTMMEWKNLSSLEMAVKLGVSAGRVSQLKRTWVLMSVVGIVPGEDLWKITSSVQNKKEMTELLKETDGQPTRDQVQALYSKMTAPKAHPSASVGATDAPASNSGADTTDTRGPAQEPAAELDKGMRNAERLDRIERHLAALTDLTAEQWARLFDIHGRTELVLDAAPEEVRTAGQRRYAADHAAA